MAAGTFSEACPIPLLTPWLTHCKLNWEFELESSSRGSSWSVCFVLLGGLLVSCVLGNADSESGGIGKWIADYEK